MPLTGEEVTLVIKAAMARDAESNRQIATAAAQPVWEHAQDRLGKGMFLGGEASGMLKVLEMLGISERTIERVKENLEAK